MTEYKYRIRLAGIKDIDALPQAPHDDADLNAIISEAQNTSLSLSERTNWATAGESLGNLASDNFTERADTALSKKLGKPVKVGHHIPFVHLDVLDAQTEKPVLSYTLPAGAFTSATIGEGNNKRTILGPTFTVIFNTLGPMAAKRQIPLSTKEAAEVTKQFMQDVMHEMHADQLVALIPNRKNHTPQEAKVDGAGLLFASMGAEPYLTTPTALKELPDDGDPSHVRENLAWVFDKNGHASHMAQDHELHQVVDEMFTERARGFSEGANALEQKKHYPHLGGGQFVPAVFKDIDRQLSQYTAGAAPTSEVPQITGQQSSMLSR